MRITITVLDADVIVRTVDKIPDEFRTEGGWWTTEGEIFVDDSYDGVEKLQIIVHEVVEWYLVTQLGYDRDKAHEIALKVESVLDQLR